MARRRRRTRSPGRGPEARVDRIGPSDKHRHVRDEAARERGAWASAAEGRGRALAAARASGGALALRSLGLGADEDEDAAAGFGQLAGEGEEGLLGGNMRARLRWDLPSRQLSVDVSQSLAADAGAARAAGSGGANGDGDAKATTNSGGGPARRALAALGSRLEARYRGVLNAGTGAYEYRGTLARHFDTPSAAAPAVGLAPAAAPASTSSAPSSSSTPFFPAGWGALLGARDWRLSPGVSVTSCPARGPPAFAGGRANAFNGGGGGAAAAAAGLGLGGGLGGNTVGGQGGGSGGRLAYVLTARKLPQVVRRTRSTDVWLTGKVRGAVEPARLQAPSLGRGGGGAAAAATAATAAATAASPAVVELPAALAGGLRLKAYRYGSGGEGSAPRRHDLRLSVGLDWAATGLRLRTGGGRGGAGAAGAADADADAEADADAAAATALLLGGAADAALRPLGVGGAAEDGDALEWALDTALSGRGGGLGGGGRASAGGGAAAAAAAATAAGLSGGGGGSGPRRRGPGGALWRAWPYVKVSADAWSVRLQRGRLAVLYEI